MSNVLAVLFLFTVVIYGDWWCVYCKMAEALLNSKGIVYERHYFEGDKKAMREFLKKNNIRSIPQIYINDERVGGYTELVQLNRSGRLDKILADSNAVI